MFLDSIIKVDITNKSAGFKDGAGTLKGLVIRSLYISRLPFNYNNNTNKCYYYT